MAQEEKGHKGFISYKYAVNEVEHLSLSNFIFKRIVPLKSMISASRTLMVIRRVRT